MTTFLEESYERKVVCVPYQLLEQWLGEPADIAFLIRLLDEKLFEWRLAVGVPAVTADVLEKDLPFVISKVWEEVLFRRWATGEVPPFHFEQDRMDPCVVNFMWEGPFAEVELAC